MVIVDSSVWIDALWGTKNGQTAWLNRALDIEEIGLTSLILYEVLQGVRSPRRFRDTLRYLMNFSVFDLLDSRLAVSAAQNYRSLRDRGITVLKSADCLIATFCIENGLRLLHNDRDFDPFETYLGLIVLHPPAHGIQ
jgi:predicted nucleic acid-binding protein